MHATDCRYGEWCQWRHPNRAEVDSLWELYKEKGRQEGLAETVRGGSAPPAGHSGPAVDGYGGFTWHSYGYPADVTNGHSTTWNSGPQDRQSHAQEYGQPIPPTYPQVPAFGVPVGCDANEQNSLMRVQGAGPPLPGPSGFEYPHQAPYAGNGLPLASSPAECMAERLGTSDFDPSRSQNPFINGSVVYHFVWGNPLCVRCGSMGHLPKDCQGEALSHLEQRYLHGIMKLAQERSKAEKVMGLGRSLFTSTRASLPPMMQAVLSVHPPKRIDGRGGFDETARLIQGPISPLTVEEDQSPSTGTAWDTREKVEHWANAADDTAANDDARTEADVVQAKVDEILRKNSLLSEEEGEVIEAIGTQAQIADWSTVATYDGAADITLTDAQIMQAKVDKILQMNEMKSERQKSEVKVRQKSSDNSDSPDNSDMTRITHSPHLDLEPHVKPATTPLAPPVPRTSEPSLRNRTLKKMGATKHLSNGEAKAVGPHPSTLRVSAPYITQAAIEKRLQPSTLDAQERSLAEAREDSVRLQGVQWLHNVRRALQLPIKTFTTACVYYHKFRLAHPTHEYNWSDAAAASLLMSCKNEDTLKKSRDILAAAYNLKQPNSHDQPGADDPMFEAPSRVVIGLERLVLESGSFDFRSRSPHHMLIKVGKRLPQSDELKSVTGLAWTILIDLHRTFAPLKQTSATLALASLELAANFKAATSENNTCTVKDDLHALDISKWGSTRQEIMETLLDALDLYTHNTASTILGSKYSLDDLLRIRLAFNKECSDSNIPRYTVVQPPTSPDNTNGTANTLRVSNGHPTPVSPPQPGSQAPSQVNGTATSHSAPEGGGTLRFMLDPQRATDERTRVNQYYTEEWEEYEEEIEVPIPRNNSLDRDRHDRSSRDRDRDSRPPRDLDDRRGPRDDRKPLHPRDRERERIRESLADREREVERERARVRDRERERRYDDRRFEGRDRDRDRRFDDRRERDRGDRRYYEDDRRRGRDDRR